MTEMRAFMFGVDVATGKHFEKWSMEPPAAHAFGQVLHLPDIDAKEMEREDKERLYGYVKYLRTPKGLNLLVDVKGFLRIHFIGQRDFTLERISEIMADLAEHEWIVNRVKDNKAQELYRRRGYHVKGPVVAKPPMVRKKG